MREKKAVKYKRAYIFFGEESYLVKQHEERLINALVSDEMKSMNFNVFEGKDFSVEKIVDAAETLPFMNEYRLLLLKDTGLFVLGRKDDSDFFAEYIKDIPESTVILFVEKNVDKRNRLYKKVSEIGQANEFKTPPEKELISWTVKLFSDRSKVISNGCAAYLLRMVAHNMETVYSEVLKLTAYKGNEKNITTEDINAICSKSIETKIFDLTDAIGNKKSDTALDLYANMILMKESPIGILVMITRQFRLILQCGYLANKRSSPEEIASVLGLRSFVVNECLRQSKHFSQNILIHALNDCLETDINIKTGIMGDKLAVEMLIVKYCL